VSFLAVELLHLALEGGFQYLQGIADPFIAQERACFENICTVEELATVDHTILSTV
jgi:hypothetical protein